MNRCGYSWFAPYILPPSHDRTIQFGEVRATGVGAISIQQKCSLPKGHDGPHRSNTNVITES